MSLRAALCIAFGVLLTLAMQGYQFGGSNHTVYLIDALRQSHPDLLANDWFATKTLQYHAAFGVLTRALMTWGITRPAFLIGYIALLLLLHTAWWRIVRLLGCGEAIFLLSEVFFHLSAGGAALGMYQFMQDAAFLPSNIAAVAMLWGIYFAAAGRLDWSAAMMGLAGLFHLNYAIVAPIAWLIAKVAQQRKLTFIERMWALAMIEMCLMNIVPALILIKTREGTPMPLDEFVDLYVRLRHPHHYDPSTWPVMLWVSFLWPLPFAFIVLRFDGQRRFRRADHFSEEVRTADPTTAQNQVLAELFQFFCVLIVIALIGAGIWYWSETLVQLSLWRFSIFIKLLSCIAAAIWIRDRVKRPRPIAAISSLIGVAMIAVCAIRGPYFGFFRIPSDDASYLAACDWIRQHTPTDAVFLVPPGEQEFRLRAQRAIVVNYKCVPQVSTELGEWRTRLHAVLRSSDLHWYRGTFAHTLAALSQRYDAQSPDHYQITANEYGARYILVGHRLPPDWERRRIDLDGNTSWFLYDLTRGIR